MLKGECQRENISEKEDVDLKKREEVKHEVIERRKEEREKRRRERERGREGAEGRSIFQDEFLIRCFLSFIQSTTTA